MNYRHIYHAGNFADIVKHLTLIAILENFHKKESGFYVLDAFAGIGLYDLGSAEAKKTLEAEEGIKKLMLMSGSAPDLMNKYLGIVKRCNVSYGREHNLTPKFDNTNLEDKEIYTAHTSKVDRKMRGEIAQPILLGEHNLIPKFDNTNLEVCAVYPGSPYFISHYTRPQDRADFCELHKDDFSTLKRNIRYPTSSVHNIDAYVACRSLVPPRTQKRGLILLDPPFEKIDEFDKTLEATCGVLKSFSQAVIMIWLPIKNYDEVKKFYSNIAKINKEILKIEFSVNNLSSNLKSCAVLVINPPFIQNSLQENLEYLEKNIYSSFCKYNITILA